MSFSDHKIQTFTNKIASLPDQPNMLPDELKAYFDSSPEELREALNALCDALGDTAAAANLGFAQTAGVPASTVQGAIENVQAQVSAAVVGSIPSGSITEDKLGQDVLTRLDGIEDSVSAEASSRVSADSGLQSQISTHTSQIAQKSELYCGTYTGNGNESQFINLGFTPTAVIVFPEDALLTRSPYPCGGMALSGHKAVNSYGDVLEVVSNGFNAYFHTSSNGGSYLNLNNNLYFYMALK